MPDSRSHRAQVLGSLAVAGLLALGSLGVATAAVDVVAACTGEDPADLRDERLDRREERREERQERRERRESDGSGSG